MSGIRSNDEYLALRMPGGNAAQCSNGVAQRQVQLQLQLQLQSVLNP